VSKTTGRRGRSAPLNRDRVIEAAAALTDADGLAALTMRSLAAALGVKPMSLYNHIKDKEDLLDGMVDLVFGRFSPPDPSESWRPEVRARAVSARTVLAAHPWALALMDSRPNPGPAALRHHDAVVGVLMNSGFSPAMTARAYTLIDAYVYGFVLQESALAAGGAEAGPVPPAYPHLAAFAAGQAARPGYDFHSEFEPGLDLVLDAVATLKG
jgi:AcrR family transcriptional regulator